MSRRQQDCYSLHKLGCPYKKAAFSGIFLIIASIGLPNLVKLCSFPFVSQDFQVSIGWKAAVKELNVAKLFRQRRSYFQSGDAARSSKNGGMMPTELSGMLKPPAEAGMKGSSNEHVPFIAMLSNSNS